MEPVEITEAGLTLRPWRPTDADDLHRAGQDPEIQRWIDFPRPYRPQDAQRFIAGRTRQWAEGTAAAFAVCDAATGRLLGAADLQRIDRSRQLSEIGYWTAPWARGQGVAVRAVRALARWSFAELDLRRLLWTSRAGNHAARLVALRSGFRIEGRLRAADPAPGSYEWVGSLLPGEVPAPGEVGPAGPGSLEARRAAVFGRAQPTLFASTSRRELRLRPLEDRDLDALVITCQDPETLRWTTVPEAYDRSAAVSFLAHCEDCWAGGTATCFVIADEQDRYAGSIDLRLSSGDPLLATVGFMTAPHARGRGYQTAALAALTTWGFATLGLARIEWWAKVGNVASRRVAEKVGFAMEGTARAALNHRGTRADAWVGALLAEDLVPLSSAARTSAGTSNRPAAGQVTV
ncbi:MULTISPECIES: GNAT family N-acetyltransferase [Micromonospora]|uniref:GCN5 family acetyltransferase n=1 Tax=Micromonospora maris TaxID=1003110 RepID=A0A9X0I7T7_9ACTN|nr:MULTISPECIES: GNAT family N-acetyltransferase [Micromonospora]AEB43069.1 GCN5-related N-acetyltransferase [Micromonospora maris AB-18-032]KUJ48442.1 GCN5 family acetyltransferase [Micromonospora maris]RUL93259.1 N-acetyltransferase [Verrucosispora sp. FIM060022]